MSVGTGVFGLSRAKEWCSVVRERVKRMTACNARLRDHEAEYGRYRRRGGRGRVVKLEVVSVDMCTSRQVQARALGSSFLVVACLA